jgi:sodium/hydrogen antiporter
VYASAALILFAVRPVALALALAGSELNLREYLAAAWFGPKGFASVVYGLLIMHSVPHVERGIQITAITVTASILAHSSTDVPIARWLAKAEDV